MAPVTFSGMASGIDSAALIDAVSEASRKQRVTPNQTKIEELGATDDSLTELKTKLGALKTVLAGFSTLNGGGVARQAVSSDESVLSAAASNSAASGTYSVNVSQLATNGSVAMISTARTYTSSTSAINPDVVGTGTVTYTIGSETVTVDCTSSTTLAGFVSEFNSKSTLATASLVNRGTADSPNYIIMVVSKSPGTEKGIVGAPTVSANLLSGGAGAFDGNQVSAATNARFSLNGITGTIERSSNTIGDVISGVTFNLASTGTSTVSVGVDSDQTIANVQEFVDAYNEIVTYLSEQNKVERQEDSKGVTNVFSPLAKTQVDDSALSSLRAVIASVHSTNGPAVNILADLGVTTPRDGTLAFDTNKLKEALHSESDSVNEILKDLGDTAGLTGGTIDQYIRYNGLIDIVINSNQSSITNLNERITRAEAMIEQQAARLKAQYARLESTMSKMQSQQNSLSGILASM